MARATIRSFRDTNVMSAVKRSASSHAFMMKSHSPFGALASLEHVPQLAKRIGARRGGSILPHRVIDSRYQLDRLIEPGITPRLIAAHQAKIACVFVFCDHGAQLAHKFALLGVPHIMCQARNRGEDVDGRI